MNNKSKTIELIIVYCLAMIIIKLLKYLEAIYPFIRDLSPILHISTLILVPIFLIHFRANGDFEGYGITIKRWPYSLLVTLITSLIIFPCYLLVCYLYAKSRAIPFGLQPVEGIFNIIICQIFVVAIPEEVFFRGYIQSSIETMYKKAAVSIIITSLLFSLTHFIMIGNPVMLLVFFPSIIFGWLRYKTGSIISPVLFHALCNIFVLFLKSGIP